MTATTFLDNFNHLAEQHRIVGSVGGDGLPTDLSSRKTDFRIYRRHSRQVVPCLMP